MHGIDRTDDRHLTEAAGVTCARESGEFWFFAAAHWS
jgi:hypothetical protein